MAVQLTKYKQQTQLNNLNGLYQVKFDRQQNCDYKALGYSHKIMIPNNSKCLKQQEDSRARFVKQSDLRLAQISMPDYCPHLQNPIEIMENYIKNQIDLHQPHNYLNIQAQQCFYDPNFQIKNNWCLNNNNYYEQFYSYKIKREQYDQQKQWPPQIKDEESPSANHDQGFQAYEVPKQQEFQYTPRCAFQDPNNFLGPISNSKQQKNKKRKLKVQAYLKKKNMRSYEKKIIYKCRKEVADNRIRFRGRFISLAQASQILKIDPKEVYSSVQLMEKLKACSHFQFQKQQKMIKQRQKEKQKQKQKQKEKQKEKIGRQKKLQRQSHHSNLQFQQLVVQFSVVKKNQEEQQQVKRQ